MLDPVLAAVEDIDARIGRRPASPALREFRFGLARARRAGGDARELLPDGAVCEGAARAAQATQALVRLQTRAGARLREIESEPQQDPRAGDATEEGGHWARWSTTCRSASHRPPNWREKRRRSSTASAGA